MLPKTNGNNSSPTVNGRTNGHDPGPAPLMLMGEIRTHLILILAELERRMALERASNARYRARRRVKDEILARVSPLPDTDPEFRWVP